MESELRAERGARIVPELAIRLGIGGQSARVLAALYQANGRVLRREFLQDHVMPSVQSEPCSTKHLDVTILRIRKAAGFGAVQTHTGLGYSITSLGQLVCEEALERRAAAA
jgi:DNA-binding response OmpR family regulator